MHTHNTQVQALAGRYAHDSAIHTWTHVADSEGFVCGGAGGHAPAKNSMENVSLKLTEGRLKLVKNRNSLVSGTVFVRRSRPLPPLICTIPVPATEPSAVTSTTVASLVLTFPSLSSASTWTSATLSTLLSSAPANAKRVVVPVCGEKHKSSESHAVCAA